MSQGEPQRRSHSGEEQRVEYAHLEDEALVGRVVAREEAALEALYDRYGRRVYSLALTMLHDTGAAEEVAQEVFLSVWRRAASFSKERGRLATWILSIAHHRAVDALRSRRRRTRQDEPMDERMERSVADTLGESPDNAAVLQEEGYYVRQALQELPPEQQRVLVLAYYHGLTQGEIARKLGHPLGTVKTRMRLGIHKLRQGLEEQLRTQA